MGALVAYELLKYFETSETQSPNLPVALVAVDCPAPHLFAASYRPQEQPDYADTLERTDTQAQGRIVSCVSLIRSYTYQHGKAGGALPVPVCALCHAGLPMVNKESCAAWDRYAKDGDFQAVDLGALAPPSTKGAALAEPLAYLEGVRLIKAEPKVLNLVSEACTKYSRWLRDGVLPDIGPTDSPLPDEIDCVVVGAGICGVYQAMELKEAGRSLVVLEKYHKIGGVWQYYGNDYSRVNTSEIGYRIVDRTGPWSRPNEDHTPRRDILRDIHEIASKCYGCIHCNVEVVKVDKLEDGSFNVLVRDVKAGTEKKIHAKSVSFHVNRRIGNRREVDWPKSDAFGGKICYGYGNEVQGLDFWGKKVLIIGAGAFAYENVRTALEHGARKVTLLGRRDGTTSPKWIDMLAFLRPLDETLSQNKSANMVSFDTWQRCYMDAGLKLPDCWKDGLLKPNGHTISVSDLAFIAGFHGMCELKRGEVDHCMESGVQLKDGSKIPCDIIIKCCGFLLNEDVPKITGYKKMQPFGLMDFNLNYQAEPKLDGGQFGSNKDKTEVQVTDMGFTTEDYLKGLQVFHRLGMDTGAISVVGNPFGSGQGGPIKFQSEYFAYLLDHPEEQRAMLRQAGAAEQDVVDLWASHIGQYSQIALFRLISCLAKLHIA